MRCLVLVWLVCLLALLPSRSEGQEQGKAPVRKPVAVPKGMVEVPAGTFIRGSDDGHDDAKPRGEVTVSGFFIDVTEVTVDAYAGCVRAGRCTAPDTSSTHCGDEYAAWNNWTQRASRGDHPINCVTWRQADTYCRWARKRLPTEAEWEKAARGVDGRTWPWGEAPVVGSVVRLGNFSDATAKPVWPAWPVIEGYEDGYAGTGPVGSFPAGASPWGALDMAGNVQEWVADWYSAAAYAEASSMRDPKGPDRGVRRVTRGSSFVSVDAASLAVTYRSSTDPAIANHLLGFRCARSMR